MAGWTNKGFYRALAAVFRNENAPSNFYLALVTSAVAPGPDTDTLSDLTEIATGNGYSAGGYSLTPGSTDFDSLIENDADDRAELQLRDILVSASGGSIPDSGSGARYAVLLDDNATPASREVLFYWDLTTDRTVSNGQTMTLPNMEIRALQVSGTAGFTNKGLYRLLEWFFRQADIPTNFNLALATSAVAPGPDINTLSDLTEIAAGYGYTAGGTTVNRNSTDFDVINEDDVNDRASIQLKDFSFTASGGPIPASGDGARYAVLLDDNATAADREVIFYWDLESDRSVTDGNAITVQDSEMRAQQAA